MSQAGSLDKKECILYYFLIVKIILLNLKNIENEKILFRQSARRI